MHVSGIGDARAAVGHVAVDIGVAQVRVGSGVVHAYVAVRLALGEIVKAKGGFGGIAGIEAVDHAAAAHLEALGNPTRLKIYRTLIRAGAGGLPVGRLQDKLKIAPSTLSHHIKALVVAGLVNQVREATTLVCHANYEVMQGLVDFLVAECCADAESKDAKTAA